MISVVSVYNDKSVLRSRLLDSLEHQSSAHEIITVDNRDGQFVNAVDALNHGAIQTRGKWVMFAHQDVSLLSSDWLGKAESLLEQFRPTGWTGVAGLDEQGCFRGFLIDSAMLLGAPFDGLVKVQTLDECLLIHKRKSDGTSYFDKDLHGWHAYGVEACCRAIRDGCDNGVFSLPVWHDSKGVNLDGLEEAHKFVWRKHGGALGRIYTTCGALPDDYGWAEGKRHAALEKSMSWGREKFLRLCGFPTRYAHTLGEWLEAVTVGESIVEVLHERSSQGLIETKSFVAQPHTTRRILHRFSAFDCDTGRADCVVVAPELAVRLLGNALEVERLLKRARRVIVCLNFEDMWTNLKLWNRLKRLSVKAFAIQKPDRVINYDGTSKAIAVFELYNVPVGQNKGMTPVGEIE